MLRHETLLSPSNEAEDIKGQVKYGKGSKGDKEQHDSKSPPSPDGQTGLKQSKTKQIINNPCISAHVKQYSLANFTNNVYPIED